LKSKLFTHLLWRVQLSILRACPPLSGIVTRISMGAATSRRVWVQTFLKLTVRIPGALLQNCRDRAKKRVVLPCVSLPITTRCTLRCDKCLAHIPDVKNPRDIPIDEWAQDAHALFSCIDYAYIVELSGGEPFLHPDLGKALRLCADSGKVGHIVVLSNATVIPEPGMLAALREAKANVLISKYSCVPAAKAEELKRVLDENSISYMYKGVSFWRDAGNFGQLQAGSAKRRFSLCSLTQCSIYLEGKLHRCNGKAAILIEEGLLSDCQEDYIDLRVIHSDSFSEQWKKLLKKRFITACSYCLGSTYCSPKVPVAVQREYNQRRDIT